jgi:hypothetical protein
MRQFSRHVVQEELWWMVAQAILAGDHFLFTLALTHGVSAFLPAAEAHAPQRMQVV